MNFYEHKLFSSKMKGTRAELWIVFLCTETVWPGLFLIFWFLFQISNLCSSIDFQKGISRCFQIGSGIAQNSCEFGEEKCKSGITWHKHVILSKAYRQFDSRGRDRRTLEWKNWVDLKWLCSKNHYRRYSYSRLGLNSMPFTLELFSLNPY